MAAMDYVPLNFDLLKSPVNWLIVTLMIAIAGLALAAIFPPPSSATAD